MITEEAKAAAIAGMKQAARFTLVTGIMGGIIFAAVMVSATPDPSAINPIARVAQVLFCIILGAICTSPLGGVAWAVYRVNNRQLKQAACL